MEEAVIGLDIGTTSIKLVIYGKKGLVYSDRLDQSWDGSRGREIDPDRLLENVIRLLRRAKKANGNLKLKAIGLSALFPSFIALDEKGRPLTKILTWLDNRGDEIAQAYCERPGAAAVLKKKTGCVIHGSHPLWKILWLKQNDRRSFNRAKKFLSLPDYLVYKLTGKSLVSHAIASTTGLYNVNSLKWDKSILKLVGISENRLPKCRSIFHSEKLLEKIRKLTGLGEDVLLVLGAGDGQLSNIGSGCLDSRTMCSTIGTSAALRVIGGGQKHHDSIWRYYFYDNNYISGIAINAGSSTLDWFNKNIFQRGKERTFSGLDGIDLDKPTETIVLPFLAGERGPGQDHLMSACLCGLKSSMNKDDIYRAVIEGILFNLYHSYQIMVGHGQAPIAIAATGGYRHSGKMLQMQADIFNIQIKVPEIREASAVGAALVCLAATGELSLSKVKAGYEKVYIPNPRKHSEYMIKYKKYRQFYELSHKLLKHGNI